MKELRSKHEEADTRIVFHANYIGTHCPGDLPTLVVQSCDADVFVLLLYHQNYVNAKFWMDTGTSSKNTRRMINVVELAQVLISPVCSALPAFHAFTGSDYTTAFLRKAKARPYNFMIKNPKYLSAFTELGTSESVEPEVLAIIEDYVCSMHGVHGETDVNITRFRLFKKLYAPKNLHCPLGKIKSTDPCCLPLCKDVLQQKVKRTNYVAQIWRNARAANPITYSPDGHVWKITDKNLLEIVWFEGLQNPTSLFSAIAEDISISEQEEEEDDGENISYSLSSDEEEDDHDCDDDD